MKIVALGDSLTVGETGLLSILMNLPRTRNILRPLLNNI